MSRNTPNATRSRANLDKLAAPGQPLTIRGPATQEPTKFKGYNVPITKACDDNFDATKPD